MISHDITSVQHEQTNRLVCKVDKTCISNLLAAETFDIARSQRAKKTSRAYTQHIHAQMRTSMSQMHAHILPNAHNTHMQTCACIYDKSTCTCIWDFCTHAHLYAVMFFGFYAIPFIRATHAAKQIVANLIMPRKRKLCNLCGKKMLEMNAHQDAWDDLGWTLSDSHLTLGAVMRNFPYAFVGMLKHFAATCKRHQPFVAVMMREQNVLARWHRGADEFLHRSVASNDVWSNFVSLRWKKPAWTQSECIWHCGRRQQQRMVVKRVLGGKRKASQYCNLTIQRPLLISQIRSSFQLWGCGWNAGLLRPCSNHPHVLLGQ